MFTSLKALAAQFTTLEKVSAGVGGGALIVSLIGAGHLAILAGLTIGGSLLARKVIFKKSTPPTA